MEERFRMLAANAPGALALLFIFAMVWFRTRLHYPRAPGQALRLTRAGLGYFGALLGLLLIGWVVAPLLARRLGLGATLTDISARAVWFLAVYAMFIPAHRLLKARDIGIFARPVA
jgi:prolipoprotein diacylglyceryltransferase